MARFLKKRIKAKGAAPGSFIFIGTPKMDNPRIRLFSYNNDNTYENEFETIEKALENINPEMVNWLNIDGLHDISLIRKIARHFDISALAIENVLDTGQRCKLFEDKNSITILSKAVYYDSENNRISVEQISFILAKNILISFQEKVGDHFEPVRERIRNSIGRIRKSSTDFLLYSLIDSLVDNYFINIEKIGEKIENIEQRISVPDKEVSAELFNFKREISFFRKTIRPLKEVMTRLLRLNTDIIKQDNNIYYQELFDLVDHSNDAIDTYFSMINDHINLYNTNLSNKVNDVMKVLTIFASIFIPLTFIAGIYGTNFDYVPELHFRYSYFVMLGIMLAVALTMLFYFKKNKWF
jgi:magnesium transporter